jgi:2-hydroxychromene-2-carboxylate isomerase
VNDPVGRPTERGLALIPLAQRLGRGEAYVSAFMHGVWAEGIDAGSDRGLRSIVQRAGLPWADAQDALQDQSWREVAERNRQDMFALGIWGVPSFVAGDTAVWGQDRLWAIQEALLRAGSGQISPSGPGRA